MKLGNKAISKITFGNKNIIKITLGHKEILGVGKWQVKTDDGVDYWHYRGAGTEVEVPEYINQKQVTTCRSMFENTSVKKVTFEAPELIINMRSMFANSQATTLDLSSFDTSNVTDMVGMFSGSKATTLDLSSFDTSSVTDMGWMFANSQATTLDLSSFDTSNVTDMVGMFSGSKATTGYARTPEDVLKFNESSGKPSALTFVVKP